VSSALSVEPAVGVGVHQGGHVDLGWYGVAGGHRGDLGVDELHAEPAGQRHPVVAVDHEVGAADLDDLDRREVAVRVPAADRLEPSSQVGAPRREGAVEIAVAVEGADDGVDPDGSHAEVAAVELADPRGDLVQRQQVGIAVFRARHWSRLLVERLVSNGWCRIG